MTSRMVAQIDPARCDCSPMCPARQACPAQAIAPQNQFLPWGSPLAADPEKCTGCARCVKVCPRGAISMAARGETNGEATATEG